MFLTSHPINILFKSYSQAYFPLHKIPCIRTYLPSSFHRYLSLPLKPLNSQIPHHQKSKTMTVTQKPLLLKDFLELDPNSDSNNSFISLPRKQTFLTVRFLIQAEQCRGAKLLRSRSKNALSKLSNMFSSVSHSSTRSSIARKLSRRLWSRSKKDEGKVTVKDIVRLNSFELYGDRDSLFMTSPVVSSCSSCSDSGDCSDSLGSISSGGSECFGGGSDCFGVCDLESKKKVLVSNDLGCSLENHEGNSLSSEHARSQSDEEKEQFSPVSIMDFPNNSEDNNEENDDEYSNTSPYFAHIERTTHQLLQKIRRFETLAELEFSSSDVASDDEYDESHVAASNRSIACDLIQRLKTDRRIDPQLEQIIVDFFMETMSVSLETSKTEIQRSITIAEGWVDGGGLLAREDHGKAQLCDMERNGRWRSFQDGRDDVAADLEFAILESLIKELVIEISEGCVC